MTDIRFVIKQWSAWAPDVDSIADWESWSRGDRTVGTDGKADASDLPPMLRRRLSPLARAVFHVANQCCADGEQIPMVFSSAHGESVRTYDILETIAGDEDVSPTAFSLSVHNSIAGQYSIFRRNRQQSVTIAPGADGVMPAFLEAAGLLAEGAEEVLLIFYDEQLPKFYTPYVEDPAFPAALALRLGRSGAGMACDIRHVPGHHPGKEMHGQMMELLRFLVTDEHQLGLGNGRGQWIWRREG